MKTVKRTRRYLLLSGIILILFGAGMVFLSSEKTVRIIVNGKSRNFTTYASSVSGILQQAGIPFTALDQVRPGLNERVRNGQSVFLNRAVRISLENGDDAEPIHYTSHQHFGGNILLDAGLRLYPGDRLFWKDTEIRPDFDFGDISDLELRLNRADYFTLVTEAFPEGRTAHGSGKTVSEALRSAGVSVNSGMMVIPDGETPFLQGMTVETVPLRELTISYNGVLTQVRSAGSTVGEALARAGLPLTGSDVSIPAAGEPLPADGRILIVPVRETFSMDAQIVRRETDWTANEDLELDETGLLSEGMDGLRGTFTRHRTESGETVLNEASPEAVLIEPVNDRREYGTKIRVRTLDTPDGPMEYYRAVKVYATSYSPCRSGVSNCITGTASGMKVQKGVAAVTSQWYNQFGGQTLYIPDYGKAVIADVGGGIPGRRWIDLAYEDDNFEAWSRETTVYFLTPVPQDIVWVLP